MRLSDGCRPTRFVGVYNADAGLRGELIYVRDKLLGKGHCALCDITHGWNPLGRSDFRSACRNLELPIDFYHLNDMDAVTTAVSGGRSPVVLACCEHTGAVVVDEAECADCAGDPQALIDLLNARLADPGEGSTETAGRMTPDELGA